MKHKSLPLLITTTEFFACVVLAVIALLLSYLITGITTARALDESDQDETKEHVELIGDEMILLPSRKDRPFASQHELQRISDLQIFPAKYRRRSKPIAAILLSQGSENPAQIAANPQGWNVRYPELLSKGFKTLNPIMSQLRKLGFRDIWFWGWSGQHTDNSSLAAQVMPWLSRDAHTRVMRRSWPRFVRQWKRRGMRFGFWLGGTALPNFGTTLAPHHRYIQSTDFKFIADTIRRAKRLGFRSVGLDAFSWILSRRDRPEWASWGPNFAGPRAPGIGIGLLNYLAQRKDLRRMHIVTEKRVPYGPLLAANPTLFLMASDNSPRGNRTTPSILEAPLAENIINPGHEMIAMLSTDGWTLEEYTAARTKIEGFGYRFAVNTHVLYEIGLLKLP